MALIYDEPVDDEFSVCVTGSDGEYFVYLYKTGYRGTVYNSYTVKRPDHAPLYCEIQAWRAWALDTPAYETV